MAATLDRLSGGRLLVNLVTGGDSEELAGDGLFLAHSKRYELSREFMTIYRETLQRSHDGESFDFEGEHLRVQGAKLLYPPIQRPYPPMFFGGSSEAAHELCAEQLDTYLTWVNRRPRWPRKSPTSGAVPQSMGARCSSASGCT